MIENTTDSPKRKFRGKRGKGGRPRRPLGYTPFSASAVAFYQKQLWRYLSDARADLVKDLGPREGDLTAAQLILVDRAISKLTILRCIEEHAKKTGLFKGDDLIPPLRHSYTDFSSSLRLDLTALGVSKRKGRGPDLDLKALIRIRAEEKAGQAQDGAQGEPQAQDHGQGPSAGQGEPEKSPPRSNAGQIQAVREGGEEEGDNG